MRALLWLIPFFPLLGYLILALGGARFSRLPVAFIGVGAVAISAVLTLLTALQFTAIGPAAPHWTQSFYTWISIGDFAPRVAFYLDPLSLLMTGVITGVGLLILLYCSRYMIEDEGYSRFFAYMNLFVAMMLVLVLADNLLLLLLGWEGVGLCSYLLIGFYYRDAANGRAAIKAFVVTRAGDVALMIALFLLFTSLRTLDIQLLMQRALVNWPIGSGMVTAAALLLLGGAVGKSAQLPLQTWLPDAMAGPTPVSALIHAATMVTAGVYLIARTHVLFYLAPAALTLVGVIGAATLLLAGFSALVQTDIKRILAYSTMSQIGYMFLALGVGAWQAAMFHFMTHAFFKALLFMAAGVVILSLHHEQDIFKMGGLRKQLPVAFWTFLAGSISLASLPLVTAGFYSKDLILFDAWADVQGSPWLWAAGWIGALLTGLYTFRLVFIVFFGPLQATVHKRSEAALLIPLFLLAVLSLIGGFVELPPLLGNVHIFSDFLGSALPAAKTADTNHSVELVLQLLAAAASLTGIYLAYRLFIKNPHWIDEKLRTPLGESASRFLQNGWGFDAVYNAILIRPFRWFARINRDDFFDSIIDGIAWSNRALHRTLSVTETGQVRWYAAGIAAGAVFMIAIGLML